MARHSSLSARQTHAGASGRARPGGRNARRDSAHDRRASGRARPVLRALALAGGCFVIYLSNLRLMGAWDSIPARMLPISILREGNLDLDEFPWLRRLEPTPYFLAATSRGHVRSRYPIAVPLLAAPLS